MEHSHPALQMRKIEKYQQIQKSKQIQKNTTAIHTKNIQIVLHPKINFKNIQL